MDLSDVVVRGVDAAIKNLEKDDVSGGSNSSLRDNSTARGLMMPMEQAKGPAPSKPLESVDGASAIDAWMRVFKQLNA